MSDYIQALRSKDDTPGSSLSMSREAEAAILDKYRADITAMQEGEATIKYFPHHLIYNSLDSFLFLVRSVHQEYI